MASKKTVAFNLMVTGHSRAGKTDSIHTIFETLKIVRLAAYPQGNGNASAQNQLPNKLFAEEVTCPTASTCAIECHPDPQYPHKISLILIDTPGLSVPCGLNRAPQTSIEALHRYADGWATSIVEYCEKQFNARLEQESKIKRTKERDSQVHACLYLLSPDIVLDNNGLSSMDSIALRILCEKMNVIPCIGKSDLISVRELKKIKGDLLECFRHQELPIYHFIEDEEDQDEKGEMPLESHMPFCLVNSEELSSSTDTKDREMGVLIDGQKVLGREFRWGIIDVENSQHCDLSLLKSALFDLYIDDLKDCTDHYYEKWRTAYMSKNQRSMLVPADLTELVQSLDEQINIQMDDQPVQPFNTSSLKKNASNATSTSFISSHVAYAAGKMQQTDSNQSYSSLQVPTRLVARP